jgi:hypothetical protein
MYARKNEAKVNAQKNTMKGSAGRTLRAQAKPQKVLDTLERIEIAIEEGDAEKHSTGHRGLEHLLELYMLYITPPPALALL